MKQRMSAKEVHSSNWGMIMIGDRPDKFVNNDMTKLLFFLTLY